MSTSILVSLATRGSSAKAKHFVICWFVNLGRQTKPKYQVFELRRNRCRTLAALGDHSLCILRTLTRPFAYSGESDQSFRNNL